MGSEQAPHRTVNGYDRNGSRGAIVRSMKRFHCSRRMVCLGPFGEQMLQCSFVLGSYLEA